MKRSIRYSFHAVCQMSMPPNPRALTKHTIRRNIVVETALCLLNVVVGRENEIGTYITINNKYIYRVPT